MKTFLHIMLSVFGMVGVSLIGFSKEANVEKSTEDVKTDPKSNTPPRLPYKYLNSKLDPFKPWVEKKVTGETEIIDPLQKVDLKDMTLVGTILGNDPVAMVTLPGSASLGTSGTAGGGLESRNETFMVRIGEPVGNRRGKLIAIAQDHIVVRELAASKDGLKRHQFHLSILKMASGTHRPKGFMMPGGGTLPETSQSLSVNGTLGLPGESIQPQKKAEGIPPTIHILPNGQPTPSQPTTSLQVPKSQPVEGVNKI